MPVSLRVVSPYPLTCNARPQSPDSLPATENHEAPLETILRIVSLDSPTPFLDLVKPMSVIPCPTFTTPTTKIENEP